MYRGARKVIIVPESKVIQPHICRRLNLLRNYYGAKILQSQKVQTKEDAMGLLSEMYSAGPIGAIFVLPTGNAEIEAARYLDTALRVAAPKALLVNFVEQTAGVCRTRQDAGFRSFNVQWQEGLDFKNALRALDKITTSASTDVLVKYDQTDKDEKENAHAQYQGTPIVVTSQFHISDRVAILRIICL